MQLTSNTQGFIDSEVYSSFVLRNLDDGLLGEQFYRNVSDFNSGETLNIKTVGRVTLQEVEEDTPITYSPIETGTITLSSFSMYGDAWYVTDELREDGTNIDMLLAMRASESTRAIQEKFESDFLAVIPLTMTASDPYNINGFAHKIASAEANNVFALSHLIAMRLAFDKAKVPSVGRVFIVDPVVEATLAGKVDIQSDVTPFAADILRQGLAAGGRFLMNLYGWDIMLSNRLYVGDANDGTTSITGGVWNLFMCVADDNCKPVMGAWRRMPKAEYERNKDYARDEHVIRCRYVFGVQRMDTVGVLITSATDY